ncbi:multicomponent Na+:H+ antiporter subunit C [Amycolatopsis arida]|uniref:Multicomponent Na+:H+ antiporter subunit C n=1 Tax=Amycolatopsis arida TaxID=587909 RepID=A0A1I6AX04_9PSEU|nr:Na(+)/H(+) antiporter subunit C [Amycolatopsis arida]TDX85367.1 multicomponent Na+:H+ antiporter subunit C [Amycolatopsis arida]SFQ73214.1 multicomponent Na+:H+ antiporter subunit C [Amycolatopsis arida]
MTISLTMAVLLGVLYAVGFHLLMQRSLMRVVLGVVILGHAANLLLQTAGGPPGEPVFLGVAEPTDMADPLPQALALTAIVITFGLTTFLLALSYRAWVLLGHDEVRDDVEDSRIRAREEAARADELTDGGADEDEDDDEDSTGTADPADRREGRR